jgi:sulfoxide reductase heme-binding subunit YedZ
VIACQTILYGIKKKIKGKYMMKKLNEKITDHILLVKIIIWLLCLSPLLFLIYAGINNALGANPVEKVTRFTGTWGMNFLWITLAITPVRKLLNLPVLLKFRRMTGVYSFFYILLHFIVWFWLDHSLDFAEMWKDIIKRPFITVGFAAFILLIPLALTSWNKAIKWLGGKNWQKLHMLIYPISILGILHFYWMKESKNNLTQPYIYLTILILLLGYRLIILLKKNRIANNKLKN